MGGKAYPEELRIRVINAHQEGATYKQVAERFVVSLNWVAKVCQRWRDLKRIEPLPRGGNRPPKITQTIRLAMAAWINETPDMTLRQIRDRIHASFGVFVSEFTVCYHCQKLGLTLKKKSATNPSAIRLRSKTSESSTKS
jgi:transposase